MDLQGGARVRSPARSCKSRWLTSGVASSDGPVFLRHDKAPTVRERTSARTHALRELPLCPSPSREDRQVCSRHGDLELRSLDSYKSHTHISSEFHDQLRLVSYKQNAVNRVYLVSFCMPARGFHQRRKANQTSKARAHLSLLGDIQRLSTHRFRTNSPGRSDIHAHHRRQLHRPTPKRYLCTPNVPLCPSPP